MIGDSFEHIVFDEEHGLIVNLPEDWCNRTGVFWMNITANPPALIGIQLETQGGGIYNVAMSPESAFAFAKQLLTASHDALSQNYKALLESALKGVESETT